jgi:hypothetical protein
MLKIRDNYDESSSALIHPFSWIIAGSSQSGKTEFTKHLIKHLDSMIFPKIDEDILSIDNRVNLVKDLDFDIAKGENRLVIIDDQMNDALKNPKIQDLFTKGVHHRSISVILITQNLFPQEKFARTIRLNATYMSIFKSPTFNSQVVFLGRQLFPNTPKFLSSAYEKETETPYSYIFINLHPICDNHLRVRSNILPCQNNIIYIPQ